MCSHRAGELRPTLDGTDGSEMFAFSACVCLRVGARARAPDCACETGGEPRGLTALAVITRWIECQISPKWLRVKRLPCSLSAPDDFNTLLLY